MAFLRACRKAAQEKKRKQGAQAEQEPLRNAWNQERLRVGFMVGGTDVTNERPHAFSLTGCMRMSWQSINKGTVPGSGIDGTHRVLEVATTSAALYDHAQLEFLEAKLQDLKAIRGTPCIYKIYDATPMRCSFGSLQSEVLPHARFPVLTGESSWTTMTYEQHRESGLMRKYGSKKGVLELLAQQQSFAYLDQKGLLNGAKVYCKPAFLQAGNSSCLFTATERAFPSFDIKGIATLAAELPYICYIELPDGHSANTRKKAKTKAVLPDNCLHFDFKCAGHQAHRAVAAGEKQAIGDCYAICLTASHVSQQNSITV